MDHSVWGYLNRRSDEELEMALLFCLEQKSDFHKDIIMMIFKIMKSRHSHPIDNPQTTDHIPDAK